MEQLEKLSPQHSRPLDVHKWSDHPEAGALVDQIWQEYFSDYHLREGNRSGPKPKTRFRHQLRVLILDLYLAWSTDPAMCIGVHLSVSEWNTNSRYNALHLSRVIPQFVHRLADAGLLELSVGSYSGPGAVTNRNARIRAAEPLKKLFRAAKFGPEHIGAFSGRECIVLKNKVDPNSAEKEVEYTDTPATIAMRDELKSYNCLLAGTFIDIPSLDVPRVERQIKRGARSGELTYVPITPANTFVRRIFNRGDWSCGGRFWGGWWQQIGSELRKQIVINDQPTVEVDFEALHVTILSTEKGVDLNGDPYILPDDLVSEMNASQQRKLVKHLILMALNAPDRTSACKAFRNDCPTGSEAKSMTDKQLNQVLDAFLEKHPHLGDCLCADQGIRLMHIDSQIASLVINHFTRTGTPVLCVHDSFLIDWEHSRQLSTVMRLATMKLLGKFFPVKQNYQGIDQVRFHTPQYLDDYIQLRTPQRTAGYRARQRLFEERKRFLGLG